MNTRQAKQIIDKIDVAVDKIISLDLPRNEESDIINLLHTATEFILDSFDGEEYIELNELFLNDETEPESLLELEIVDEF